jgi:hypothetical protein
MEKEQGQEEKIHEVAIVEVCSSYGSLSDEDSNDVIRKFVTDWQKVTDKEFKALAEYIHGQDSNLYLVRNVPKTAPPEDNFSFDNILESCLREQNAAAKRIADYEAKRRKADAQVAAKKAATELKKARALAIKHGLIKE